MPLLINFTISILHVFYKKNTTSSTPKHTNVYSRCTHGLHIFGVQQDSRTQCRSFLLNVFVTSGQQIKIICVCYCISSIVLQLLKPPEHGLGINMGEKLNYP